MDKKEALEHATDSSHWHFFETGWEGFELPFGITKYMVMILIAAGIMLAVFIPVARRLRSGEPPRGKLDNAVEFLLVFIRDQVARPSLGKDANLFLPYLWTVFVFILLMNLLGLIPFMATATSHIMVTGALAIVSFLVINVYGVMRNGVVGYAKSFVPHVDMDDTLMKILGPFIIVGITVIEVVSMFIKCVVLAIRLFGTMLAGHIALFVVLAFIKVVGMSSNPELATYDGSGDLKFWGITALTLVMELALFGLELFIGALQAFVFTFLTAVFLGMALHPEH